uniref:F-actin monooxygenase n=1 Tax=Eptatretus burgeri TaxID=7764 RepID=A0A8C4WQI1_EPTBU
MGDVPNDKYNQCSAFFDNFVHATTCKGTLRAFHELCDRLGLQPSEFRTFYPKLKAKLNYWRAKSLWSKIDKRAGHKDYKKGKVCSNIKCLIIGAGPCGLRMSIELALLGAKVVVVEKRDVFSRNNVLHLWPFTIHDLKALGAKKFYGKFCAGAIDHISIRQLQLMLLKVSLVVGVQIHFNVEFLRLLEPPEDQENERLGWRAEVNPRAHPVAEYEFDTIVGADGRRNTLEGFRRKEFRGKLAIAITAKFINRHSREEAKVEEISGVAFIFNQKFFQDLRAKTGIDLENIVYYKDDTHYFVMTAKKHSLLEKGAILQDHSDTEMLLSRNNVDQEALQNYAIEAANFSTNDQLPDLTFAINHYGQPDVAMFDFTCMYASENAALVRERHGHRLLVGLVGDSLLEPFWPMGTGCARGFLAVFDLAWTVRSCAQGSSALEVLAQRESIYRLLPQTTPENLHKNFNQYSVDPSTRYPNASLNALQPRQVLHLLDTGEHGELGKAVHLETVNFKSGITRQDSLVRSSKLLSWCQRQTEHCPGVCVVDLASSWKSGLALCAIIHRYRPDLIKFDSLDESDVSGNNQLAFDVAEREFGISPIMTGKEMAGVSEPDKLSMVMYLTQFYDLFKEVLPPEEYNRLMADDKPTLVPTKSPISFLSKLGQTISRKRTPKASSLLWQSADLQDERQGVRPGDNARPPDGPPGHQNKVKSVTNQLLAKFEESVPSQSGLKRQGSLRKEFPQNVGGSDVCYFCKQRVYVMERLSAEGKFFHRGCFKCDYCGVTLRLGNFAFDVEEGKFYCKPHFCHRKSGYMQRKRRAGESLPREVSIHSLASLRPHSADTPGTSIWPSPRQMPVVEEPCMAKRARGTPERIELEDWRPDHSVPQLFEVTEEVLAEHNLSATLDRYDAAVVAIEAVYHIFNLQHMLCNAMQVDCDSMSRIGECLTVFMFQESSQTVVSPGPWEPQRTPTSSPASSPNVQNRHFFNYPTSPQSPVFLTPMAQKNTSTPLNSPESLEHNLPPSPLSGPLYSSSLSPANDPSKSVPGFHFLQSPDTHRPLNQSSLISPSPGPLSPNSLSLHTPTGPGSPDQQPASASPMRSNNQWMYSDTTKAPQISPSLKIPPAVSHGLVSGLPTVPIVPPRSYLPRTSRLSADLPLAVKTKDNLQPESKLKVAYPDVNNEDLFFKNLNTIDRFVLEAQANWTKAGLCTEDINETNRRKEQKDESHIQGAIGHPNRFLLTPPSSPPPPPPTSEEPATLPLYKPHPVKRKTPLATSPQPPIPPRQCMLPHGKSLEESIDDIPFADEDDEDEEAAAHEISRASEDSFHTPPTSRVPRFHKGMAEWARGTPFAETASPVLSHKEQRSPEEVAENRLWEQEQNVQSSLLREMMARQREKIKEKIEAGSIGDASCFSNPNYHQEQPLIGEGNFKRRPGCRYPSKLRKSTVSQGPGGSTRKGFAGEGSSETSQTSTEEMPTKSQRKHSLFSSHKNKNKDKVQVNTWSGVPGVSGVGQKSTWSGAKKTTKIRSPIWNILKNCKDRQKAPEVEEANSSRASSGGTGDSGSEKAAFVGRNLSKSRDMFCFYASLFYVQKVFTEEELNAKLTRRVQRAARKQAKQDELKRLHRAQIIQRQLEEVEEKQKTLEQHGVAVEKAIRGEAGMCFKNDDPQLMQEWFRLVQEKNTLPARELELEDRQSRLQQELRERMALDDTGKSESELAEEKRILNEMLEVVEHRDALVALLEEQRLREKEEDRDIEATMLSRGYKMNWT